MEGALGRCAGIKRDAGPAVILVASPDGDDWAQEALAAGARGILTRNAGAEQVIKAIRVVHEGQIWAPRHVMAACLERLWGAPLTSGAGGARLEQELSRREREVFRHAAIGLGNKELAARLTISEATVKVHMTRIFQKLGLRGRAELAAVYHGLTAPGEKRMPLPGGSAHLPARVALSRAGDPTGRVVRLKA
jgi:DNA-binding NarL/FixJ family response regulator